MRIPHHNKPEGIAGRLLLNAADVPLGQVLFAFPQTYLVRVVLKQVLTGSQEQHRKQEKYMNLSHELKYFGETENQNDQTIKGL
ncbi:hypothetical protein GCM10028895_54480 [Pontibacter rugosus]